MQGNKTCCTWHKPDRPITHHGRGTDVLPVPHVLPRCRHLAPHTHRPQILCAIKVRHREALLTKHQAGKPLSACYKLQTAPKKAVSEIHLTAAKRDSCVLVLKQQLGWAKKPPCNCTTQGEKALLSDPLKTGTRKYQHQGQVLSVYFLLEYCAHHTISLCTAG